jgi:lysophospholipase L1-like esterase
VLPWLLGIVLGPPALCALGLAALRPADASWTLALLLLSVLVVSQLAARRASDTVARVLLVLVGFGLLLWPEMALRLGSFRFEEAGIIQFGHPRPDKLIHLQRDPELFWKLPSGDGINSEGFLGAEFEIPKPENTARVLFFGDSCTQQGLPRTVVNRLNRKGGLPDDSGALRPVEGINFGVSGYSSHQGLVLAERWTERLEADAVVIYFGWNDHWQAYGQSDSERAANASGPGARAFEASRLVQWLATVSRGATAKPLSQPRVTLEEYRNNITAIGDLAAARGAQVVLVTAPSSHEQLGVPAYLIEKGFAKTEDEVVVWHRAYNAELRRIGVRRHWLIVDLMRETEVAPELPSLFMQDGIHFTGPGMAWAGIAVADVLSGRKSLRSVD